MTLSWFTALNPIYQTLVATLFTWGMTALGAALVFFFKLLTEKSWTECSALPQAS